MCRDDTLYVVVNGKGKRDQRLVTNEATGQNYMRRVVLASLYTKVVFFAPLDRPRPRELEGKRKKENEGYARGPLSPLPSHRQGLAVRFLVPCIYIRTCARPHLSSLGLNR